MDALSPSALLLVRHLHPAHIQEASDLLARECGRKLPLCADSTDEALDRLRFAALKVASGDLERLREAVALANVDWRDLLVWAGFADDLSGHLRWFDAVREERL